MGRSWMRALMGLVFLGLAACGDDEPPPTGPDDVALRLARARAAALFSDERFPDARAALEPLLQTPVPEGQDLVRAAVAEMWIGAPDSHAKAVALLERARRAAPDDPAVHYNLGKLHERGQTGRALEHMRRAHELAPDDYPTTLNLAGLLEQVDQRDEAVALYERLRAQGVQDAGSWHLITLYQLGQIRIRQGRRAEAEQLQAERDLLVSQGVTVPSADQSARGNFGSVRPPDPGGGPLPRPVAPGRVEVRSIPGVLAGSAHLRALTLRDDWEHLEVGCRVAPPDLVAWGPAGLEIARATDAGAYASQRLLDGEVLALAALDLDNDRALDFAVATSAGVTILVAREDASSWDPAGFSTPVLPGPPSDLEPVDYDHDGDVDLLLVGSFGARLWRNDGLAVAGGTFTDATAEAGLPVDVDIAWCCIEDFDTDQDVDLLLGGAGRAWLLDNQRGGRFLDRSGALGTWRAGAVRPVLADLDADGRPDVLGSRGDATWLRGRPGGGFPPVPAPAWGREEARPPGVALDWDQDGAVDVLWQGAAGGASGVLAFGLPQATPFSSDAPRVGRASSGAFDDLDGDGRLECAEADAQGLSILENPAPVGRGFRLALRGVKDNARGVGAVVEVRAGPIYRRIFWRGEPQFIGLGTQPRADVVRITWPNGVIQHDLDVAAGCMRLVEQAEGLVGSCPFLYTWNGTTYEYVSDVLGITPMGLPMAPGMLVPPDHDEYVRIRGEQMQPRALPEGGQVYEMQFTEELREVTYLDRARLLVIDHPADTEMFPTERFTFPPFPEHHVNVVKPVPATRALGSDGQDWTRSLAAVDGDYAAPFSPHRGQFLGLAPPHWLELTFDPVLVGSAPQLRMVFTGWFFWTDASVNMASARTPGVDFIPPILQVPDETSESGWRDAGPPVGFPAGKTKSMVLDVSGLLRAEDPRIRVFCGLRLYWDAIRLAAGGDHASTCTTIEPASAWLWERGFSRPIPTFGKHALDWFDWNETATPRWNPHPGMYTKFGDVLPLVQAVDDQFVILGSGDALRLRFDATAAPSLREGWRRDFLVYLDGWAKDRDPNTHEALFVEPLPFHGMRSYPYPPDQAYPDTHEHRAYRDTWNTRPSRTWIPPLAPGP